MAASKWFVAATLAIGLSIAALGQDSVSNSSFTVRPTAYSGNPGYIDPSNAYDGNLSTASGQAVGASGKGATARIETWYGFPSTPSGATGMQLSINSSALTSGYAGFAFLEYSLDGGNTFNMVYGLLTNQSWPLQTNVIALSNSQDLTKVQVRGEVSALSVGTGGSYATQSIYEIWITGND
jgi:hypothetical protein